jgi:hypothetical protein
LNTYLHTYSKHFKHYIQMPPKKYIYNFRQEYYNEPKQIDSFSLIYINLFGLVIVFLPKIINIFFGWHLNVMFENIQMPPKKYIYNFRQEYYNEPKQIDIDQAKTIHYLTFGFVQNSESF